MQTVPRRGNPCAMAGGLDNSEIVRGAPRPLLVFLEYLETVFRLVARMPRDFEIGRG